MQLIGKIFALVLLYFSSANALTATTFVSNCFIQDSYAISIADGKPTYFQSFQNFYVKGETLNLSISSTSYAATYVIDLVFKDKKRDRHMVNYGWMSYKEGLAEVEKSDLNNVPSGSHSITDNGFVLSNGLGHLLLSDQILKYVGVDTFLELRPYTTGKMQGTMIQNLDYQVTQSNVQTLLTVLNCETSDDLSASIDQFQATMTAQ